MGIGHDTAEFAVASIRRWRLVNGKELYDIQTDPGQKSDAAAEHPEVVKHLRAKYEAWWADVSRWPLEARKAINSGKGPSATEARLQAWLVRGAADGQVRGAYYIYARRLPSTPRRLP